MNYYTENLEAEIAAAKANLEHAKRRYAEGKAIAHLQVAFLEIQVLDLEEQLTQCVVHGVKLNMCCGTERK